MVLLAPLEQVCASRVNPAQRAQRGNIGHLAAGGERCAFFRSNAGLADLHEKLGRTVQHCQTRQTWNFVSQRGEQSRRLLALSARFDLAYSSQVQIDRRSAMTRKRFLTMVLFRLVGAAALGCWQRQPILAWWRVHQLMQAPEAGRTACVDAVVALDQAALPRLVSGLTTGDATACGNLEEALVTFAKRWKALDPRALVLMESLHSEFAKLSPEGQATGLRTATALLCTATEGETLPAGITLSAGCLLKAAERIPTLRPPMLHLAGALLDRVPAGQWLGEARNWASQGLAAADSATRAAALHLTMRTALRGESNLLTQALPLLRDP